MLRRSDLNDLIWPVLTSFASTGQEWRQNKDQTLSKLIAVGSSTTLKFDADRVFDEGAYDKVAGALCRLVFVSTAAEFELFVAAFWHRISVHPALNGRQKSEIFDPAKLQIILGALAARASIQHPIRVALLQHLPQLLAKYDTSYVTDLVMLQAYFRQVRNCLVHNDGLAETRMVTASNNLRSRAIQRKAYWKRHRFKVTYYASGDRIQLSPHTCIATVHFLSEFVFMLSGHFVAGDLGEVELRQTLETVLTRAQSWIEGRRITSPSRLTDEFLAKRIRAGLWDERIHPPTTLDVNALSREVAELRRRLGI